jgi:hypothetical protein
MAKTIQIVLPDNEAQGIKIADISGKMAKVYVLPKSKLSYAQIQPGLRTAAVYFLFNADRSAVFVGACENFAVDGLKESSSKDWHTAVICTAPGGRMEHTDALFLQTHAIKWAKESGKVTVLNAESPPELKINDFKLPIVLSLFSDFECLLSTLGFLMFTKK